MTGILDRLEITIKWLAGICLALVFILVTAQVASRFVFNFSLAAASELSIFAMIWCVFLAAAVAFRRGEHIAMDFVRNAAPTGLKRVMEILVYLGVAAFLLILIHTGYDLSLRAMRQMSTAAGLPVGYISMAMPVCSVLALIFLIENAVKTLNGAGRND